MHEMRNSERKMIAKDRIRPTLLVEYEKKPRELILGGGCKVDGEVVMKTKVESARC
jgi:hypothetical protein